MKMVIRKVDDTWRVTRPARIGFAPVCVDEYRSWGDLVASLTRERHVSGGISTTVTGTPTGRRRYGYYTDNWPVEAR